MILGESALIYRCDKFEFKWENNLVTGNLPLHQLNLCI